MFLVVDYSTNRTKKIEQERDEKYIDLARAKSEALVNILIIYSNRNYDRGMLNGVDNENGKKTNKQRTTTFFVHFLCRCCRNVKLPSYTFYGENHICLQKICCLRSCSLFFSLPLIFTFCRPLAFLILTSSKKNIHVVVLPTKFVFFVFYLSL